MHWKIVVILLGGCLFLISGAGFLFVKIALRPKDDSNLDDYHFEFEDHHPQLARYEYWSRITFAGVIISMLMLFAVLVF
jgi:hypothetical protein